MSSIIGLDIGKRLIDVCVLTEASKSFRRVENNHNGLKQLVDFLKNLEIELIVCEPTGGYEKKTCLYLIQAGYQVHRVNSYAFSHFARSVSLCKSDKQDSAKLAIYGQLVKPQANFSTQRTLDQLKAYQQFREDLVLILSNDKRRLDQASEETVIKGLRRHIQFLEKEIKGIEKACDELLQADEALEKKINILVSIPGIGRCLAVKLITFLPELGSQEYKLSQLSAITGLAPYARDSGNKVGRRFIRGGRKVPRDALFMAVLSGKKKIPLVNNLCERILKKGKAKKVGIVAGMRKLLAIAHSLLRRNALFITNP
jgi:transposase